MNKNGTQEAKELNEKARQNSTPSGASKISYTHPELNNSTGSTKSQSNSSK